MTIQERLFALFVRAYPRAFRERYCDDLLAFFRADRAAHAPGIRGACRFWIATIRDLARAAASERLAARHASQPSTRGLPMRPFASLAFDLKSAVRSLAATPAVTLTALLVLTVGIGAGTAIFSVVDATVLRGLPFRDAARLAAIGETDLPNGRPVPAAYVNFVDWSAAQNVFGSLAASSSGPWLTLAGIDRPERFRSHKITANLFDVLGVRPAIGAGFTEQDERTGARVAVLSDEAWRRHFGADPSIVGRSITFDSGTYTITGVMPAGFKYPISTATISAIDLWTPYTPTARELVRGNSRSYSARVVGRLKPGVSLEQAAAQMQQIRDALAAQHPAWFADRGVAVTRLKDAVVASNVRSWMLMLLAAVAGVFLIACANLGNLLLARAAGKRREIGVRAAIGASRWQIVRGMVVESVVLALGGTVGGLILAFWGVDLLRATLPAGIPRTWAIAVDLRVVTVAMIAGLATGVLCGLLPALQMSRADISSALRRIDPLGGGRSAWQRMRLAFLTIEVALAAILLVGAGIFGLSFYRVATTELGYESAHVLHVNINPSFPAFNDEGFDEARRRFESSMEVVLEAIRPLPGVQSAAAVAGGAPLSGSSAGEGLRIIGRETDDGDQVVLKQVTPGYFETIGATLLTGRFVAPQDTRGAPTVIVLNDEAVRQFFDGRDPISVQVALEDGRPRTIVGVVRGMRLRGPEREIQPEAYIPYAQSSGHSVSASLVVRTAHDPANLVPAIRNAVWSVLPGVVIPEPRTFDEMFAAMVAQRKLNMVLLAIFGALAVLIACIGIYGMLAYVVEQRTKEIGVRMALGALPAEILRMILGRASLTIASGLAVGFLVAAWLERLIVAFAFQAIPRDPRIYGTAAVLLLLLGLLAAFIPASRAARIDPLRAIRNE